MSEYNGWTNHETWCVNLWITNTQGDYEYWRQQAHAHADSAASCQMVEDGIWTIEEAAKFNLADEMKEGITENGTEAIDGVSLFSDLISSALGSVNWHEIAEAFLEGVEYPEMEDA